MRLACHVACDVFGCSLGLSGGICFAATQPSLCCGVVELWMTLLSFGGWHVCWPDFVPVSALWRVVRGFASVGLFPTSGFLVVVASLVCSGFGECRPVGRLACSPRHLRLAFVWFPARCVAPLSVYLTNCPVLLPGRSSFFLPGAAPRKQLLNWPCDLPVSCPGVSLLASRGLSLHDLALKRLSPHKKKNKNKNKKIPSIIVISGGACIFLS
jgi:hypothetical protein